jgi:DNA polymerase-3 subunit delta'
MSVFDSLIGQEHAVEETKHASLDAVKVSHGERGDAMTHAWLITGPPGSGRSTLAMAFAASLVCPNGGCGECIDCRNVAAGVHPDVEHIVPEGIIYTVEATRALTERASLLPTRSPWHVIVVEDVDRFRVDAASTLLKTLEEPPPQTVWLLCAPTVDDVFPTIRSRCRHVLLNTPTLKAIAAQLTSRYGIDPAMAAFASRAAQGHIGRARALATDEAARIRRKEILDIPTSLRTVGSCFELANKIVSNVNADADSIAAPLDDHDDADIRTAYGEGAEGKGLNAVARQMKSALKDLDDRMKKRRRRIVADQYDRVLLDLTGYYRDILVLQSGSDVELINEELRPALQRVAEVDDESATLRRIAAITETRDQIVANVNPLNAFESLLVTLRDPRLNAIVG